MPVMKRLNQYLKHRGDRWNYHRRVPLIYQSLDTRGTIRVALDTACIEIARARRDALTKADELFWRTLQSGKTTTLDSDEAAKHRAMSRGFVYIPAEDLAVEVTLDEILNRLKKLDVKAPTATSDADARLGLVKPAAIPITEAFAVYCNKICAADLQGKRRAVNNFVAVCGDLPMDAITRTHAKSILDSWSGRVSPTDGSKPPHANSANKDLTNLRILFERFWQYQGEDQRDNPFRNLRFKNVVYKDIPAFENDWIKNRYWPHALLMT